jgi:hypothetical protein
MGFNVDQDVEFGWMIHDRYELLDDIIIERGHVKSTYSPHTERYLYQRIAKIQDARSAMRFVRRFGALGYQKLAIREFSRDPESELSKGLIAHGEQVNWIIGHANTLKICMEIGLRLEQGEDSISEYFRTLLKPVPYDETKPEISMVWGPGKTTPLFLMANMDSFVPTLSAGLGVIGEKMINRRSNLINYARTVRKVIVNLNIADIHPEMPETQDVDTIRFRFRALIQMVYWSLAQDLCSDDPRPHKRCPYCQSVFIQGSRKQRFCPPYRGQRESSCAYNFRKRDSKS